MIEARSRRDACCGDISSLCLDLNLGMMEALSRSSLMIKKRVLFGLYNEEITLPKEACFQGVCKLRLTREEAKQVTMNSLQT